MGSQATLGDDRATGSASDAVGHGVGKVAAEFVALAELQCQLVASEARELKARYAWVTLAWLSGLGLAFASLPAFLIALGYFLTAKFQFSPAGGMACAATASLGVAGVLALSGWLAVRSHSGFGRSKEELHQNIQLLKTILTRHTP